MASGPTGGTAHASLYGPYHRKQSRTQTYATGLAQVASGELWGRPAVTSPFLSVKAYRGALPAGDRGIEFYTPIKLPPGSYAYVVFWFEGNPGVTVRNDKGVDYAIIPIIVTKHT